MVAKKYKSPLHEMVSTTVTDFWNDSCSIEELKYAIEHGAVGATTNPVIVGEVLKKELPAWEPRIKELIQKNPTSTEEDIAWMLIEEMAVKGSELLFPVFQRENKMKGRISIQTNPKNWPNAEKLWQQAVHFNTLAPNMQVKIPVSTAGVKAIEEAAYHGVNINATVCFSVAQAIAVAEAIERAMKRREKEHLDCSEMRHVCTIMVGRVDDWLKVVQGKENILIDPGYLEWGGVTVFKTAYNIYKTRKYRTRLLAAAYRNQFQWSELIGGDIVMTIPSKWQKMFNKSDIIVKSRIDEPVNPEIIKTLYTKFPVEFKKCNDEDGMKVEDFDNFGPNRRTLLSFLKGYDDLVNMIRERMIPNPDK